MASSYANRRRKLARLGHSAHAEDEVHVGWVVGLALLIVQYITSHYMQSQMIFADVNVGLLASVVLFCIATETLCQTSRSMLLRQGMDARNYKMKFLVRALITPLLTTLLIVYIMGVDNVGEYQLQGTLISIGYCITASFSKN